MHRVIGVGIYWESRHGGVEYAAGNRDCYPLGIFGKEEGILAAAATEVVRFPGSVRWFPSANPLPKGAAYACSGFASRGGVSHRDARRLRGQSTIEYVLLIAIVALVVIIAAPGVASAIRNQFNQVSDAIGSGTSGENFFDAVDLPDPQNGTAFAVYSEDDHSLMFYKRRGVPKVGDMFNYRTVTEVYTGFETDEYTGTWPSIDSCPWFGVHRSVTAVRVVDEGIAPRSMAWWFHQFGYCTSFELGKLDTSRCVSIRRMFSSCAACTSITGTETWDVSALTDTSAAFDGLFHMREIAGIGSWNTSALKLNAYTFYNLPALVKLDISGWSDSSLTLGKTIDYIGYVGDCLGTSPGSGMSSFRSLTVGTGWRRTADLATELEKSGAPLEDGRWYALSDGTAYASADIPSNKADTYFVSRALRDAAARA